jgi:superfamily II DNA or RNA helicase
VETGSSREFIQRLGRLLRPKNDKNQAKLIEIISSGTSESLTSEKRHRNIMN